VELIAHVRRLQVLDSIAACGSFSGAADALQMTQSAVSQHVATLERAMDLPLIERGTRPVQLTDAGFALVRHARALIARIGNAEQELGEITGSSGTRAGPPGSTRAWP
jgi:DNA-binding transcriptional LysR family regulator